MIITRRGSGMIRFPSFLALPLTTTRVLPETCGRALSFGVRGSVYSDLAGLDDAIRDREDLADGALRRPLVAHPVLDIGAAAAGRCRIEWPERLHDDVGAEFGLVFLESSMRPVFAKLVRQCMAERDVRELGA